METALYYHSQVLNTISSSRNDTEDTIRIRFEFPLSEPSSGASLLGTIEYGFYNRLYGDQFLTIWLKESIMPRSYVCRVLYNLACKKSRCRVTLDFNDTDTKCAERWMQMLISSTLASKYMTFDFKIYNERLLYLVARWIHASTKTHATIFLSNNTVSTSISSYKAIMSSSIKARASTTFYTMEHHDLKSWFLVCSEM